MFSRLLPPALLAGALAACYGLYSLAFGATFRFDDFPNLEGLANVRDWESALAFILTGKSSGIGRPLALAGFLINAPSWPSAPADFFHVNACIHLLNGALVAWLSFRLLMASRGFAGAVAQTHWPLAAVIVAALWLLNPLLLSTSMMAVQRMTLLSATCVLATLVAYLAARDRWFSGGGSRAAATMLAGILALGGGLGLLFKETAINLVIYVGLIEYLLLARDDDGQPQRMFRWCCVLVPLAAIAGYVAWHWQGFMGTFAMRDFTVEERLLSAPRILADYLLRGFVPLASSMGPFHDDFEASRGWLEPVSTLWLAGFWLALVAAALAGRRRHPVPAFAVLWFIGGHFLEAGPFALELYFEHRNYLPLFGPMLLVALLPFLLPLAFRRAAALVAAFGLLLTAGLAQSASLWGRPFSAADVWAQAHPRSLRAVQYYAQSFFVRGEQGKAAEVVAAASADMPRSVGLVLSEMQLRCGLPGAAAIVPGLAGRAKDAAADAVFEFSALETVSKLTALLLEGKCPGLTADDLLAITGAILDNTKYRSRRDSIGHLHYQRGKLYMNLRNLDSTIREFDAAFAADPDIDTLVLTVGLLWDAGLGEEADRRLRDARGRMPANPILGRQWAEKLDALERLTAGHRTP